MGYEDVRRQLDPVREFFERTKVLRVSTSYVSERPNEPTAMINVDAEFMGAYVRDDKLVIMMRFDDTKVHDYHIEIAYDAIRKRVKKIVLGNFPKLLPTDLAIYVLDSSGNLADLELE